MQYLNKKKLLISIFLIFGLSSSIICQDWREDFNKLKDKNYLIKEQFLDSIKTSGTLKNDTDTTIWRLSNLSALSADYQFEKFDSLLIIVNKIQDIIKSDCNLNAAYSITVANTCFRRRKLEQAKESYLKIYDCQDTSNSKWVSNFINVNLNLGILEQKLDNSYEALDRLFKIESLMLDKGTSRQKFIYYQNIGLIFDDLLDYQKGLEYMNKALSVEDNSEKIKMNAYYNKMNIFEVTQQRDSCNAMKKILLNNLNSVNRNQKFNILGAHVGHLITDNKLDSAQYYLNILEKHYRKNKLYHNKAPLHTKKGYLNYKQGKLQAAIDNYDIALEANKEDKIPIDEQYRDLYQHRLKAKIKLNIDTQTVSEFVKLTKMNDILLQNVIEKESHKSEEKFEAEKKEIKNKLLIKEAELKNVTIIKQRGFIATLLIALLSFFLMIWNYNKSAKERKLNIVKLENKNKNIEALNKEIKHRTTNHFALAAALISKHKSTAKDEKVISVLTENENRLRTLTLLNQKLSNKETDLKINLKHYLEDLIADLTFSLKDSRTEQINISFNAYDNFIDSEKALRIGLITNELVTNSVKHAETGKNSLDIAIQINKSSKGLSYNYQDNGISAKDSDTIASSQGLKLISSLVNQLEGNYSQTLNGNFKFEMEFQP